jgi:acetolactate synthase I/II/III large subunit
MTAETRSAPERRRPSRPQAAAGDGASNLIAMPRVARRAALPAIPTVAPAEAPAPAALPSIVQPLVPSIQPVTAAEATAAELKALGVECLFLMTGRDNTLWISLQDAGIKQLLARTEAAAVYMADGYARVTGRPTFVYGGYGPGAANVAAGLAEPFWSSSPVIAMCSAMRRTERYRGEYQELDQVKMFEPVTKWAVEAPSPGQLPRLIQQAARRSVSGTPGPVYLGVPGDIYEDLVPGYQAPEPLEPPLELPLARPAPSPADAEAAVASLAQAKRPIILAGNGIHQSGAWRELESLAQRLRVPVVTSVAGKGAISDTNELALGTVGRYSRNYANDAVRAADVILAIGTGLGGMVTDSFKLISRSAHLIHVTVESDAIGQNFRTDLGVVADARAFLNRANEACEACGSLCDDIDAGREAYIAELAEQRAAWRQRRSELARDRDGGPLRPEAVMAVLDEVLDEDAIICADTGYASAWAGGLLDRPRAGRNFFRADGSLGWSFAGALGAQLAAPERHVVSIIGDGGFGYQPADIETAVRLNLPVTAIVLNNQTLAFEAHVQTLLYDRLVPEVDDFLDVDYGEVARAFGGNGIRISDADGLRAALAIAAKRRGPTVIDAVIDRDAIAPVTRYDRVRTREV